MSDGVMLGPPEPRGGRARVKYQSLPRWYRTASAIIAPVATFLVVPLGVRDLFDLKGPGWAIVLAVFVTLSASGAITAVYVEQHRHRRELREVNERHLAEHDQYKRNAAVAVALPELHMAFHHLRDAAVMIRNGDSEIAYRRALVESLSHMASVFGSVTGAPCRVCVKELVAAPGTPDEVDSRVVTHFEVRTLCRDKPATDPNNDDPTPLYDNTDFQRVWDPKQTAQCFFSNDLDSEHNYNNPHREGNPRDFDYNSAIIWPIQKQKAPERYGLIGFLCVDSKRRDIFEYNTDFDLGAAYADTLYTALALRQPSAATTSDTGEGDPHG